MGQKNKCLVLLSGGQDSTTCLFWAKKNFKEVVAVGFNYGQKHSKELEQAQKIADLAGVKYKILDVRGLLGGSSLTDLTQSTSAQHQKDQSLPSSFTAGRNMLFLTAVASFGYNEDIFDIVTGVCQTDFSGYPDCRRVFIDSMETSITLATNKDFRIHTPLMYLTKSETWKLAKDCSDEQFNVVEIVRKMTLTDYNGDMTENEWGYGKLDNPASELRAKGYFEAKENGWV
jgi:7-cyano-7-deazaguanine synthase